jgi:hypothetical protein
MTGSEARALFDQSHGPFMELASAITDAQWLLPCGAEAWPVGYVVHHVGQGYERPLGWIERATAGHGPFHFDRTETHELNAQRRIQIGIPDRREALAFLREEGRRFAETVGDLSPEDLAVIGFAQGDATRDVGWIVKLVTRHIAEHERSIRATLADSSRG